MKPWDGMGVEKMRVSEEDVLPTRSQGCSVIGGALYYCRRGRIFNFCKFEL